MAWLPGVEDPDFALGVASLGLELGLELPSDLTRVYVSPGQLGAPVAAGLRAADHLAEVVGVDSGKWPQSGALHRALPEGLNINSHLHGTAALSQALEDGAIHNACVILSC